MAASAASAAGAACGPVWSRSTRSRSSTQFSLTLRSPDPNSPYAAYRHIPILMLTAIHTTTPLRFAPDMDYLPVEEFVEKPISPEKLLEKVARLLKR